MLANATRICEARFGILFSIRRRIAIRAVAMHGAPPHSSSMHGAATLEPGRRAGDWLASLQTEDSRPHRRHRPTEPTRAIRRGRWPILAGARTLLAVPMLKDDELIGAIAIYRQEVRPFTDKQIELVRTSPLRPSSPSRTRGCSTSCARDRLQQQTATSEVLKVISQFARRAGAGVRGHAGERDAHLRGQVRQSVSLSRAMLIARRRCIGAPPAFAECTTTRARFAPDRGTLTSDASLRRKQVDPHRRHSADRNITSYADQLATGAARGPYLACRCSRTTS